MAVADLIKLVPDSSLRGHSTQVVGILSLLAISGSVALLTLAGKLNFSSIHEEDEDEDEEYYDDDDDDDGSLPSKVDGIRGCSGHATSRRSSETDNRDHRAKKRVQFAEDVREPRGDSREYRLRYAQKRENCSIEGGRRKSCSSQMPANRLALYRGIRQHRLQHATSFYS